jgi:hypothetical protein
MAVRRVTGAVVEAEECGIAVDPDLEDTCCGGSSRGLVVSVTWF